MILHIIGGGMAGCEAAWQAANMGVNVHLHEMRTEHRKTEAHITHHLAELVCSNSFRNDDIASGIGLLHEEMRRCNSLILHTAHKHQVPAGGALAVDRHGFSAAVQHAIETHPNITVSREEITELPSAQWGSVIVATGPLTSAPLAQSILKTTGEDHLAFFDAIAPIVHKDSIDFSTAWFQSRYDKVGPGGTGKDYINCPLTKEQYYAFVDALIAADTTDFKEWEKNTPYFDGCLPIEVMAARGRDTLAFGPMKPVGLTNPHNPTVKPFAIVQLRQDNKLGTLYNIVGFQTKIKYGAQTHIFKMIPGLENAEFARLGGIHRNTFINSPVLLDTTLRLKSAPHLRFAGQVTGVEGYVESAACGLLAGRFAAEEMLGLTPNIPPVETALGALIGHITGGHVVQSSDGQEAGLVNPASPEPAEAALHLRASKPEGEHKKTNSFQPMNINFGLFPPLEQRTYKKDRKRAYADRALKALDEWLGKQTTEAA